MISVKIHGGLGNQLFQYAFIYTAAKQLNTNYYVDETTDIFKCSKYFCIKEPFWLRFWRNIYQLKGMHFLLKNRKAAYFKALEHKYSLKRITFDSTINPETECARLANHHLYEGYFQSEDYFIAQKAAILTQFEVRDKYKRAFVKYAPVLQPQQRLVTVHIRRGDYVALNWQLPLSYYHQAIASIDNPANHYVFISDEPEFIAKEFDYIKHKTVSQGTEIIDFQHLLHSDINIISNSSFGWWGAYLNQKSTLTIAPKYWLGEKKQYPNSITPKEWTLI